MRVNIHKFALTSPEVNSWKDLLKLHGFFFFSFFLIYPYLLRLCTSVNRQTALHTWGRRCHYKLCQQVPKRAWGKPYLEGDGEAGFDLSQLAVDEVPLPFTTDKERCWWANGREGTQGPRSKRPGTKPQFWPCSWCIYLFSVTHILFNHLVTL